MLGAALFCLRIISWFCAVGDNLIDMRVAAVCLSRRNLEIARCRARADERKKKEASPDVCQQRRLN